MFSSSPGRGSAEKRRPLDVQPFEYEAQDYGTDAEGQNYIIAEEQTYWERGEAEEQRRRPELGRIAVRRHGDRQEAVVR